VREVNLQQVCEEVMARVKAGDRPRLTFREGAGNVEIGYVDMLQYTSSAFFLSAEMGVSPDTKERGTQLTRSAIRRDVSINVDDAVVVIAHKAEKWTIAINH